MKICTVAPNYLPHYGGAELGMHIVLRYLAEHTSHEFTVIHPTTHVDWPASEVIDGVTVYRYQRPRLWARWFAPTVFGFLKTSQLLQQVQPDLVHISYLLPSGMAAWYWARARGLPIVLSLGGHDIYDPFNMPPDILRRWAFSRARKTPTTAVYSTWAKKYLMEHAQMAEESLHVVGFGVEPGRFSPEADSRVIRERHGIAPDVPLIFALQRLEIRKGVDVLIKAVAQIKNRPFHLLIGGRGVDTDALNALVAQENLQNHVTFSGFIPEEEKHLYYNACDIFALHSYHEGLGIVLAEAASYGKPLVATRAGGTTDIVVDGETGITVESGDAGAFAAALVRLIESPALRERLGQQALDHIQSHYILPTVAKHYLALFEQTHKEMSS